MAQARGSALLWKKRKYPATTSDDRFDFSRSDDDFQELAKGHQRHQGIKQLDPET